MRENDDRRRCGLSVQIVGEPRELLLTEIAHAARLKIEHIVEADEMHAAMIEGIPAFALRELAVAVEIDLAGAFVDDVVLTWHIMNVEPGVRDLLLRVIEFLGL